MMEICNSCGFRRNDTQPTNVSIFHEEGELEPGIPEPHIVAFWNLQLCSSCRADLIEMTSETLEKEPDHVGS